MAMTRRKSKDRKFSMGIPQLRQAMTHITNYAHTVVKSKNPVKKFQSEWQATFHKPLSDKVAKEYLNHIKKYKSKTMKKRGGGGGGGSPAPLAYRMEPGAQIPYGNFPEYLTKGFFVPMSDNIANCGKVDATVTVPADMGSNKVGGGKRRKNKSLKKRGGSNPISIFMTSLGSIAQRPWASQNPPLFHQEQIMQYKGHLPSPGGDPSQKTWQYNNPARGLAPLPVAQSQQHNPASITSTTGQP
jgi:hypothetical protein